MIKLEIDVQNAIRFRDFLEMQQADNEFIALIDAFIPQLVNAANAKSNYIEVPLFFQEFQQLIYFLESIDTTYMHIIERIVHGKWSKFLNELDEGLNKWLVDNTYSRGEKET
ncbi:hypothetical protein DSM106972_025550 [Dulcicalothrix desertica PCC 7102]|uniref:Uncharacterized protein n=1 Tax=Dulcicalothrix desertica PCC 7102 TaxID=232991 RepID=A0A433VMG0_9CYAN|nr:hypothetical protein [Dulcicalothrix desertica]RUT07294.1 hypothetical protein DSM106972_025550 [Dulcicalothrix desertica PCC 7102]